MYGVIGGIFALFPTPVFKTFGPKYGPQIYTFSLLGTCLSSVGTSLLVQFEYESLGVRSLFYIGSICTIIDILLALPFKEELDIERLDNKGLIEWGQKIRDLPLQSPHELRGLNQFGSASFNNMKDTAEELSVDRQTFKQTDHTTADLS